MKYQIIYEDTDILVCYKPSGLATQTAGLGCQDLVSLLKNYLAAKEKTKNPYLGIIHRLDQPVSGLLVFAKNKKAAANLSEQIKDGLANKDYLALCCGTPEKEKGEFRDFLRKNAVTRLAEIHPVPDAEENSTFKANESQYQEEEVTFRPNRCDEKEFHIDKDGYKEAVLSYEILKKREDSSLVRVRLKTGRFHQIRAQFSAHGYALLGDMKYGSPLSREISANKKINKIALCADRLELKHPVTHQKMEFQLGSKELPEWTNET